MSINNFAADSTKINKETFKIFFKEFRKHPLKQIKKLISGIKKLVGAIYQSIINGAAEAVLTLSPYTGFVIAYILVMLVVALVFFYVPYASIAFIAIIGIYFILTILGF